MLAAETWTLVRVIKKLLYAIAFHQHFGSVSPWKLGFLLRVRQLTSFQSKLEARIFSQGGKTELFSQNRNVLKAQLYLISLQIALGFLQLSRALKRMLFSEKKKNHSLWRKLFSSSYFLIFFKHLFKNWKILPNSPCLLHNVDYARFNKASTLNEPDHKALIWLLPLIDIVQFQ